MSAALPIDDGDSALICFPDDGVYRNCEEFNTITTVSRESTAAPGHPGGQLAFYMGQPTTVGYWNYWGNPTNKVETLGPSGWTFLTDFPRYFENYSKI